MTKEQNKKDDNKVAYCQYITGPCDENFSISKPKPIFFIFPSSQKQISETIRNAIDRLQKTDSEEMFISWRSLPIPGQIIFCEICKAMRKASTVVADVTTLNFNLLFEIGFAIGLGLPVIPIRDITFQLNKRQFDELGILDTIGYLDFTNSEELSYKILHRKPGKPIQKSPQNINYEASLYLLKGPIITDGTIQLMSILKKSRVHFRAYDPIETPRLSLYKAIEQVESSNVILAHLLDPDRKGSQSHNALCALICGMGMAREKLVYMIQENFAIQPIDYRDIVQSYTESHQIYRILEKPIRQFFDKLQTKDLKYTSFSKNVLESLDLGDIAAENEISGLRTYFVPTGEFNRARQGHARLVVGRKGTGKTAIFYGIRNSIGRSFSNLVLDLKPEGYQFVKLRETVFPKMTQGLQEHTMTAFWNYILICEIARKILEDDVKYAFRDKNRFELYEQVKNVYGEHNLGDDADFSQRLLLQVNRIVEKIQSSNESEIPNKITEIIYKGDVKQLNQVVGEYLKEKKVVWLLIDNLDKGWQTRGTKAEDIMILRTLLEATRKLQRQLEKIEVEFKCLVFIRRDIYEHLLYETPDKGKDTAIMLDWNDREVFREIILMRIKANSALTGNFNQIWYSLFESPIDVFDSFDYIVERTLMQPRNLLLFLQEAISIALNRGHKKVESEDITQAERSYSEDIVLNTGYEIADIYPKLENLLYAFQGTKAKLSDKEVEEIITQAGIPKKLNEKTIEILLWYGFLGIMKIKFSEEKYSFSVNYNLQHLLHSIQSKEAIFIINPAFRVALDIQE